MKNEINWGILGSGSISCEMGEIFNKLNKKIYSVGSKSYENALKYGERFKVQRVYDNFFEIFNDKNVDIIYIATPNNTHYEYILEALKAGKHVLCEKTITLNVEQLKECLKVAKEKNLIIAEAMTIYNMPLYEYLLKKHSGNEFGKLKMIQCNFGSYKEFDKNNRFFNLELGGGALLDIGIYAISAVNMFMDVEVDKIVSKVIKSETGVDEQSGIIFQSNKEELGVISLSFRSKQPKRIVISYENAYVEIENYPRADKCRIIYTEDGRIEEIVLGVSKRALEYEILNMENSVKNCKNYMKIDKTLEVMEIITKLKNEWGIKYPQE